MKMFHQLVYLNPAIPSDKLLPDGTDANQCPGEPFLRRMWAGGYVKSNSTESTYIDPKAPRICCIESIRDVNITGPLGREKVFVGVERRIFNHIPRLTNAVKWCKEKWPDNEDDMNGASIVDRRNLVFMRARTQEEIEKLKAYGSNAKSEKMIKRSNCYSLSRIPKIETNMSNQPRVQRSPTH
jgi:hypothetical protein